MDLKDEDSFDIVKSSSKLLAGSIKLLHLSKNKKSQRFEEKKNSRSEIKE